MFCRPQLDKINKAVVIVSIGGGGGGGAFFFFRHNQHQKIHNKTKNKEQ